MLCVESCYCRSAMLGVASISLSVPSSLQPHSRHNCGAVGTGNRWGVSRSMYEALCGVCVWASPMPRVPSQNRCLPALFLLAAAVHERPSRVSPAQVSAAQLEGTAALCRLLTLRVPVMRLPVISSMRLFCGDKDLPLISSSGDRALGPSISRR